MDKRRNDRRESDLSAEVYTRTGVFPADTENLSDGGVCVSVKSELPADELVGVSMFPVDDGIEDPDAAPINVPAKVVWSGQRRGPQIRAGMRFVDDE